MDLAGRDVQPRNDKANHDDNARPCSVSPMMTAALHTSLTRPTVSQSMSSGSTTLLRNPRTTQAAMIRIGRRCGEALTCVLFNCACGFYIQTLALMDDSLVLVLRRVTDKHYTSHTIVRRGRCSCLGLYTCNYGTESRRSSNLEPSIIAGIIMQMLVESPLCKGMHVR
jgi:hypothetical protein